MVWFVQSAPRSTKVCDACVAVGLTSITVPVLLYTEETRFPGLAALLPCFGTALVIYAGSGSRFGQLLATPIPVLIGRCSYSVYLVHWPLYVFFVSFVYRVPTGLEQLGLIAASLGLGWAQYFLVEERFRHEKRPGAWPRSAFVLGSLACAITIVVPASLSWASGGASWRLPEERNQPSNRELRVRERTQYCQKEDDRFPSHLLTCQNVRNGNGPSIVIWGDSHALHLVSGFSEAFPDHNILVAYLSGCVPQSGFGDYVRGMGSEGKRDECIKRNREMLDYLAADPARIDLVVVTGAKRSTPEVIAPATNEIMNRLAHESEVNAVYLGDFIRPGVELIDCAKVPSYVVPDELLSARCLSNKSTGDREQRYNEELEALVPAFIPVNGVHCPDGECRYFEGGKPLYRDNHHLSIEGSTKFVNELKPVLASHF